MEFCYSEIFCYGELLDTVQMSKIFTDSKTFVDMKLKQTPEKTLELFNKWKTDYPNRTQEEVEKFVNVSLIKFAKMLCISVNCFSFIYVIIPYYLEAKCFLIARK